MEQEKNKLEPGNHFLTLDLVIEAPFEERSLCVEPGSILSYDAHTYECVERGTVNGSAKADPLTFPHCVGCDAPFSLCQVMCCMSHDRRDRKDVQFKVIARNE